MTATDLLHRAQAAGVVLIPTGGRLKIRAPQRPPDDLLAELRAHKAELMTLLDTRPRRYAYRFCLRNGEGGGTYVTDTQTVTAARKELTIVYGARLALVAPA